MSLSNHPHGQANSVSTTLARAAGPVVLAILIAAALATVPGAVTGQMAVASDGSTTADHTAAAVGANGPAVGGDDVAAVGTMGARDHSLAAVAGSERHSDGIAAAGAIRAHSTDGLVVDATGLVDHEAPPVRAAALDPAARSDVRALGTIPGATDADTPAVMAEGAVRGEQFQRPWGLDPSTPVSPATLGGIAIGFLLGAGAFAVARPKGFRTEWFPPATANGAGDAEQPDSHGDDDLVPDAAVIEGMLLRREGRMKQSAIVEMTDWSKAKVSRLLSTMAEEGRVVKVSLGRENLICLEGWEPEAVKDSRPG